MVKNLSLLGAAAWPFAHTLLCLGLNLLIARLGLNPRWRYAVWALLVANEIRGATFAYAFITETGIM